VEGDKPKKRSFWWLTLTLAPLLLLAWPFVAPVDLRIGGVGAFAGWAIALPRDTGGDMLTPDQYYLPNGTTAELKGRSGWRTNPYRFGGPGGSLRVAYWTVAERRFVMGYSW
jgi:hypothetical protein